MINIANTTARNSNLASKISLGSASRPWPRDRAYSALIVVMFWITYLWYVRWDWMDSGRAAAATAVTEGAFAADPVGRFIKLGLIAASAVIVLSRWAVATRTLRETNRFFLAFLIMALLSVTWSIAPNSTLPRAINLASVVATCLAAVMTNWYKERFQDVVRPVLTMVCVGSLAVGIAYPDWVLEGGLLGDAWHGLLFQKNPFGQVASLTVIFWLHGWMAREIKPWLAILGMAAGMACLFLSRSSTSLLALLFVGFLLFLLLKSPRSMRRLMKIAVVFFAIIVVLYAVTVLKIVPGLEVLLKPVMMFSGKDMTFTNRSVIWDIIKGDLANWHWLGAGYGGYWIGPDPSSPSYKFLSLMWFYPNQSHNGYLEVANDLGYVGLFLLLGCLAVYARQGIQLFLLDRSQGALFLGLFFHQCVINLSEATWFQVGGVATNSTMLFAMFALARTLAEIKRTGQLPPRRKV